MSRFVVRCHLLLAVALGVTSAFAREHAVGELHVIDHTAGAAKLAAVQPPGAVILIVLDPRRMGGRVLLDALHDAGYRGRGAIVVVAGESTATEIFARQGSTALPEARWVGAAPVELAARLTLTGTPVVLGVDASHRVVWRSAGLPQRPADLVVRIDNWVTVNSAAGAHNP